MQHFNKSNCITKCRNGSYRISSSEPQTSNQNDSEFTERIIRTLSHHIPSYENIFLLGDLNMTTGNLHLNSLIQIANLNALINPFIPNAPFLYPLKTPENRKVFSCDQWVEKGCIGNKWVQIPTCYYSHNPNCVDNLLTNQKALFKLSKTFETVL